MGVKRIESGGRVLYVRRNVGWSILFFAGAIAPVVHAFVYPTPQKQELGVALYYGVPLAVAAVVALLRAEVFAIDRVQGQLMILRRQTFSLQRFVFNLSGVSVRRRAFGRRANGGVDHYIWIEIGRRSFLFESGRDPKRIEVAADGLAADLDRPLIVDDYSV
jgi:hypothetical protein